MRKKYPLILRPDPDQIVFFKECLAALNAPDEIPNEFINALIPTIGRKIHPRGTLLIQENKPVKRAYFNYNGSALVYGNKTELLERARTRLGDISFELRRYP